MKKLEEKKELKRLCSRTGPRGLCPLRSFRTRTLNGPHSQQMSRWFLVSFLVHIAKDSKALQSGSAGGFELP